ncbi:MAG TPA: LamG-like jellyroll fold domain-containing protein [Verrucomicrobiae bacterium]|nr:LamG-like jellyroll fold domain-containing protein [Verrucomicrobiae bacterium]
MNATWDTTANTNWFDTAAHTNAPFNTGDFVLFDDTGIGNPVVIANVVEPGSVTVSANSINYVLTGAGSITNLNNPVAGTNVVGLTKNNNGTLTIQTTNTYTGATVVNGGIISVAQLANGGSASAIGAAAATSINLIFNGGQLQYTGPNVTFNRGATLNAGGGTIAVSTSTTILTNSGVIAGAGRLTVGGSGTLGLAGANTYSGGTIINAGATAKLLTTGALGVGNVVNNGTLLFGGSSAVANNISGPGILTNAPGVTTLLSGANTFTGNVYNGTFGATASILIVSNSDALDGTSQVILDGGTSSTLQLADNSSAVGAVVNIPSSVGLVMTTGNGAANRATLSTAGGAGTWNGPIALKGDGTANELDAFVANSASPLTINGNVTAASADKFSGQVDFYGGAGCLGVMNGNFLFNTNADFYGPNNGSCTWIMNSSGNTCGMVYIVSGKIMLGVDNVFPGNIPFVLGSANNPGILDLAGHNQQVGGLTNNASGASGAAIITNSSPTLATLTYNGLGGYYTTLQFSGLFTNFSGIIGGKAGLTAAGGILNLSGANTYYGATAVSNGAILALTGNGSIARSANIIVGPNSTFSQASGVGSANNPVALGSAQRLTGAGGTGTLAGNMYMQANSSLVLNYDGSTPTLVVTNGTFTCTNSGVVTLNVPNSLPLGPSTSYLLVSNGLNGTVAGIAPSSVVVNGVSDAAGTLAINGAGLVLTVTNYTPKNLAWRGTVSTNWDTATTNWYDTDLSAQDYTNFATLDTVTFDDNVGVSNNLVNFTGMLQPGMVTISANNTNYTFNGNGGIVGGGGLTMSGNSTLTILTTNSYNGVTAINGGVVSVNNLAIGGAASALGAASSDPANVVINGGQLQYTGPSVSIDRGVTLTANGGTLAATTPGSTLATSGTIAGSGGLAVSGSGTVALGGANTYSGGTVVNSGTTLQLVGGGSFGTGSVTNNSTLLFSGVNMVANTITGAGVLTNAPGSALTLSGTNTYTGNIYNGTTNMPVAQLIVANSAALAPNTTVTIAGGSSSTLSVGAGVSTPTNVTLVGISGNVNINRVTLNILGAGGAWNGQIILKGDGNPSGSFAQIAAPAGVIGSVNGNTISITNGPTTFNGQLDVRGANSQGILNGSFTLGAGVLWAVNDGASWVLNSQSNSWGISDLANGRITLGADDGLDASVPLEGGGSGVLGALDLNGHNQHVAGLTSLASGAGNMFVTNSSVNFATFTCSNPANFYQANGFTNSLGVDYAAPFYAGTYTNFAGIIGGNVSLTVAAGTLNLAGVNTYKGATTINGVLSLTGSGSIGNSTNIIVGANGILVPSSLTLNAGQTLTGAGATGTIAGNLTLSAGSLVMFNNYIPKTPTLTVSNGTVTFLGGNTATVNVSGSPTLTQGSYLLVSTTGTGLISGTPPASVIVNGIANPPGTYGAYLSIQGGQLYLTISQSPVILSQFPVTYTNLFTLYKGANPIFTIPSVSGAPPFTYQWYTNNVLDGVATASSLSLTNLQTSFANDYCIVGNSYGLATSFVWSASVIADPTNLNGSASDYPSNVLSLGPIGYWRLNESDDGLSDGNPGALTHDYAGGNDGLYTNVVLSENGYNPVEDPSDTSALFGQTNSYAGSIEGIDVSTANGANGEFTIEAWVKASGPETTANGIAAKGYFGQEEFILDTGAANSAFRFAVRNAAGTAYTANSTVANYVNGLWYYLAGVCDESNGQVAFYINGVLATNISIPAGSGIFDSSATPMTIGARATSATSGINNQFLGNINDVAVFNYALSSNQIAAQYQLAGPFEPTITSQLPVTYTNLFTLFAGANPTFKVTVAGTAPFSYLWFTNGVRDAGATTNSLTLTDVQVGYITNYCVVTNIAGATTSTVWTASVIADPAAPYPTAVLADGPIGYWRMNEPDDGSGGVDGDPGVICHDYMGGNDGIYTNVYTGLYGGYSSTDPGTTSTLFGFFGSFVDNYAGLIQGVDFAAPTGTATNFTIETWENGYASEQKSASTIVSKGVVNLNAEFALDYDSSSSHNLRFYVRGANGTTYFCLTPMAADNNWHHLAGVCDESHGALKFYIDGALIMTTNIPTTAGLFEANYPMAIGAAQITSATADYTLQYFGFLNDVAAYNYALSAGQIANQFDASGNGVIAPYFAPSPPASASANANSTLAIPATAIGTPPISFAWTNVTTGTAIASGSSSTSAALNAALNYLNVPANWNGNQLELTVSNASGTTNAFVTLAISNINTTPTNIVSTITNNLLYLAWPADHIGWQLQAQTNSVIKGLGSNWVNVNPSTATNQLAIPINPANGTVFYRLIYAP